MNVIVRPAANADVTEALAWNVRRRRYAAVTGIYAEWLAGRAAIEAMPRLHSPADEAPAGREIRYYLTKKYGFRIVFEIVGADVVILAFVGVRRSSRVWLNRLTP